MSNVGDLHQDKVVSAEREVRATPAIVFELIADPSRHASWDGNENVASADEHQRVVRVGDVFRATLTTGAVRENHVVEFEEGRRIAWRPAEPGKEPPGHLWRWELVPLDARRTLVRHTYDWRALSDPNRLAPARATTSERLMASIERLCALAEREASEPA